MIKAVLFTIYFLIVLLLFVYGIHSCILFYLYRKNKLKKLPEPPGLTEFPQVTIQLPIYNELYVVERLINAVAEIDYPKSKLEIQVLDDSDDETQILARRLVVHYQKEDFDIRYYHRRTRVGFKAGALREGLDRSKGEFVAVFDADFVPPKDFLKKTIPHFSDKSIGLVQARWDHINSDYSLLTKAQAMILDTHFAIEQVARNRGSLFINFNGTAGVWRKSCIVNAGNWQDDTLSEDIDISYRAQLKGWKFIFLPEVTSSAELPVQIHAFKSQQYRWAKGTFQCAMKLLPEVFRSGLPLSKKLLISLHLTNHLTYPALLLWVLLAVPVVIFNESLPDSLISLHLKAMFAVALCGPLLLCVYSQKELYKTWEEKVFSLPGVLFLNFGIIPNNALAVVKALFKKGEEFKRTPKFKIENFNETWKDKPYTLSLDRMVFFELLMAVYCVAALSIALLKKNYAIVPILSLYALGLVYVPALSIFHSKK